MLEERKWKNSAQTETLNVVPLPELRKASGCPPSLPARGDGDGDGDVGVAATAGHELGSRLSRAFLAAHKS